MPLQIPARRRGGAAGSLFALVLAVLSAGPSAPACAESIEREVSLARASALAIEHSPVIGRARAAIEEQMGLRVIARATLLPTVDAVADYAARDAESVESFGPMVTPLEQSWSTRLALNYVIYNGGGRMAGLRQAEAARKAAEDSMRATVHNVLLQVTKAYYDALLATERIAVQEEARQVLGEQLDTARKRFEAGTGQQFAVLQAEVSLANATPALIRARAQYKLAIERLREAAGVDYPPGMDGSHVRLTSSWPQQNGYPALEESLAKAATLRPELAAAAAETTQAREQLKIEIARMRPTVQAGAAYGMNSRSFSDDLMEDPLHGWTAGLEVRLPILDLGQSKGRRMQAEARIQASMLAERETDLRVQGEVREAWLAVQEAGEILATSALVVKQAQEALRLARAGFDAGAGTQLDVLESRLALTQARLVAAEATHQFHSAMASLRRACGDAP